MESGDGGSSGENNVKNTTSTPGCGCHNGAAISTVDDESILVRVTPTTGGQFDILVCKNESVENLKKRLSKKLKVPKERICLLHRDRQLRDGSLHENQLVDGSRLTLLPSVETGLLAQRPEQSVMQALESLNDSQVNDFLSGKAPLNLTMRLGDHMMLIQLQLSTVTPKLSSSSSSSRSRSSTASTTTTSSTTNTTSSSSSNSNSTSTTTTTTTSPRVRPVTTIPPSTTCRCEPSTSSSATTPSPTTNSKQPALDTRALAEASRNLTQTLKQLSSEVLTSRSTSNVVTTSSSSLEFNEQVSRRSTSTSSSSSSSTPTPTRSSRQPAALDTESSRRRQGAIIESMHHHGKGVYSGTFSGTLNPALQDKFGRPKRDISTIIHILNDLLCATPQYRGHAQRRSQAAAAAQAANLATPHTPDTAEGEGSAQLSKENQATRGKMEQLRQFMEERRARRRARREARVAPYSAAQWAGSKCGSSSQAPVSPRPAPAEGRPCVASIAASATPEGTAATPMDTSETAPELCPELNPEPVMA